MDDDSKKPREELDRGFKVIGFMLFTVNLIIGFVFSPFWILCVAIAYILHHEQRR